ncbi:MAG: FxLYD domain-containing protein [Candidatus Alcyoniella australis]|nr:FxLYD domain-containing protein [Candidatus Alcyoniella australis]
MALLLLLILCCCPAVAQAPTPSPTKGVLLFRYTNADGKYLYTDNYNAIPRELRDTAVRGTFLPDDSGQPPEDAPPGAELTGRIDHFDNTYRIESDYLYIQGKVRNGTNATVSSVKVRVTFFNSAGGTVRTESTLINPLELSPGAVGSYQLIFKMQPDIATFKTEINWKR